jgi:hypothetical protein
MSRVAEKRAEQAPRARSEPRLADAGAMGDEYKRRDYAYSRREMDMDIEAAHSGHRRVSSATTAAEENENKSPEMNIPITVAVLVASTALTCESVTLSCGLLS